MQKTCNRESYVLSRRVNTVLIRALFFGLPSKTNQKINTLKSSILKIGNLRKGSSQQEDHQPMVSSLKASWNQVVLCYLLAPMLHAFNLIFCLLKALKVIAIPCIMVIAVFYNLCLSAQTPRKDSGVNGQRKYKLEGQVISAAEGTPMQGVSIYIENENLQITTSKNGTFELTVRNQRGKIKFSYIGYKSQEINYTSGVSLVVKLIPEDYKLEEVEVVSTGYQKIPKERATGSFEFVDNKLFNRKVSTDFVSRLEDVVPGISSSKVFPNNKGSLLNINIRGESTLNSDRWPLLVIDGVPYENKFADGGFGTFNNINPNDIENVTVLKDAAAASIWGAKAGNGVIVITTKKGKFNEKTNIDVNTNITIKDRPDLYAIPQMATSDYIDLMQYFFDKGRYDAYFDDWGTNLEPVIKLMKQEKDGNMTATQLNDELNRLKKIDIRDDFKKYIYRKAVNQQYNVRLNSGGDRVNTSIGLGVDQNRNELVTSGFRRLNLNTNTQIKATDKLLLNLGITYTESKATDSQIPVAYNALGKGISNFPYMELADAAGNPLAVDIAVFSQAFRDTVGAGRLLDWSYNPLKELDDSKRLQLNRDLLVNFSGTYVLPFGLKLHGLYAYQRNIGPVSEWRGIGTYSQRMDINQFASWDDKQVRWGLPVGDQLLESTWNSYTHQLRGTAEYSKKWNTHHDLSLLAGYDRRELGRDLRVSQYFGYDAETGSFQSVQFGKEVPYLNGLWGTNYLPDLNGFEKQLNRFVSYYGNGAYTFKERYIVSASFRKDASNLFGVKTNDRGQPFWSIGGAWVISKESFAKASILDYLKLRTTYGYSGNVNNTVSAYPTMSIQSYANSVTGQNFAMMTNPPNPTLRWERVATLNLGMDFSFKGNRFGGSMEYYDKRSKDLIAPTEIDPSTGFTSLTVNAANLHGKGWDIGLRGKPLQTGFWEWNSNLVFSYNRTKVTKAFLRSDVAQNNVSRSFSFQRTPITGMDLYSLLTYKWAGLDPEDGTPRGYLDGEISKDYVAIAGAKVTTLENHGSQVPLYFGSFRNSIRFKQVELSWNIAYQLGHKFIRPTFSNDAFLNYGSGHPDYQLRWQKPGDELVTDVPAFTYPNNANGSRMYVSSAALVENAGQIKLRDIQCSLELPAMSKYGFKSFRIYSYIQNVGTIWRANKKGIDPEFGSWYPDPLMCSLGLNFNL
ncbi:SusC/RagA family TonB-linked outer membrane protein [Sphingobacterium faecium]|uniref:SusC/RagA family TonB-linked outer membrane protein n=1 Tax=Sphingobacterium faecium TaxID=34087 RepID=UPI000D3C4AB7|nr:SusC/RagA family TonB-linked outer membrane protein [Sphingobacterium faecium]PTX11841.1 TonB-linked SusC/RagA family outer membrane protein [Sphingobacterium faecium]